MKVALIGASGQGGSRLLAELSRRGHQITAIARHPETIAKLPGVTASKGDVFDKAGLAALIKGRDAVISAVRFSASDPKLLIEAVRESGVKRYFVVGGAGSLEVAKGRSIRALSPGAKARGIRRPWSPRPYMRPGTPGCRPASRRAARSRETRSDPGGGRIDGLMFHNIYYANQGLTLLRQSWIALLPPPRASCRARRPRIRAKRRVASTREDRIKPRSRSPVVRRAARAKD
jgi:nucleoside-diphosphate-sugar epimerase